MKKEKEGKRERDNGFLFHRFVDLSTLFPRRCLLIRWLLIIFTFDARRLVWEPADTFHPLPSPLFFFPPPLPLFSFSLFFFSPPPFHFLSPRYPFFPPPFSRHSPPPAPFTKHVAAFLHAPRPFHREPRHRCFNRVEGR